MIMELDLQAVAARTDRTVEEVQRLIDKAKRSMIPLGKQVSATEDGLTRFFIVTRQGVGLVRTDFGRFHQFDFSIDDGWGKYSVLLFGTLDDNLMPIFAHQELLLMRIDSGCETGQLFGDRTCECREQLALAMKTVAEHGEGLIVNIPRQDGRGLGLPFKLAAIATTAWVALLSQKPYEIFQLVGQAFRVRVRKDAEIRPERRFKPLL